MFLFIRSESGIVNPAGTGRHGECSHNLLGAYELRNEPARTKRGFKSTGDVGGRGACLGMGGGGGMGASQPIDFSVTWRRQTRVEGDGRGEPDDPIWMGWMAKGLEVGRETGG